MAKTEYGCSTKRYVADIPCRCERCRQEDMRLGINLLFELLREIGDESRIATLAQHSLRKQSNEVRVK